MTEADDGYKARITVNFVLALRENLQWNAYIGFVIVVPKIFDRK